MEWFEAEELAVAILGFCDDDELDSDTIEQKVLEKFDVSLEQFAAVADALMPFTVPARAAISGETFSGFVKDGAFIVKAPVRPNVK